MYVNDQRNIFQIIWDLGRRCTYACSYCPPHRNNKHSRLVQFDEFVETIEFIDEYIDIYESFRKDDFKYQRYISFTGGEPTVHPDFWKFGEYVKKTYGKKFKFNMTTNGAFGKRQRNLAQKICDGGTISYHPEGGDDLVIPTIKQLRWKVNVMFHKDYFDHCIDICKMLEDEGIKYVPRRIGDDGGSEWSIRNGYTHIYTEEQEQWFADFFGVKDARNGRACCGKRMFKHPSGETYFLEDTNFNGWSCAVNWYFLCISQESRDVFIHQTCQVNHMNDVGPIGNLDDTGKMIDYLEQMYTNKTFPVIKCPKKFCGCGMCVDKAQDFSTLNNILSDKTQYIKLIETDHNEHYTKFNPIQTTMSAIDVGLGTPVKEKK